MRDVIRDAMTRPDCILGVVPDGGGMWLSPLRPDTPRNFAEKPEEWNDAMTAANQIGSDDWSFQIKMNVLSQIQQTSGEIFNNDSGSPLKIYGDLIASGSAAFYLRNYVELETWTGKHELQLDVVSGNATLYVDGTLVATKPTGLSTLNFTRASKTSADIEIEFVEFRNLTTSETVWQASRDELYETNPWPSATLRNFSEEPEYWYAAKTWFDNAPSGKMIFDFEFEQISIPTTNRLLFSNNGRAPFSCEWIVSYDDKFVFRIYFYDLYDTSTIGDPYVQVIFNASTVTGKHVVHAEASDGLFAVTMDETTVSDTRIGSRVNNSFTGVHRTTADCTIQRLSIFVENCKKFSYPSEAERVRLLTKTNVRTDRGVFEAADTSTRWNVKTPLRWQNLTAATIMARATVGDFPETVFSFGLPANPNYAVILLRRSAENQLYTSILGIHAGGYSIYRTITTDFTFVPGKKETFCLVFNIYGNFMRLYANGELLAERTLDQMVALAVDRGTASGFMLGTTSSSDAINSDTTVSYALVFDRALTAAEIAALCSTAN